MFRGYYASTSRVGTTPIRPSGAVNNTIAIADNCRTWRMITTIISTVMIGTWWEAGLIDPRISQTYTPTEGANAIAHIASRMAVGKLVVKIT